MFRLEFLLLCYRLCWGSNPNITGCTRLRGNDETYFRWSATSGEGAFIFNETSGKVRNYSRTDGLAIGVDQIKFDASKSTALYSGTSVQPCAIQVFIIIKM